MKSFYLNWYLKIFLGDKRVYGVSHVFLGMDAFGSIFSIISLGKNITDDSNKPLV